MNRNIEITLVINAPIDSVLSPQDYLYACESAIKQERQVEIAMSKAKEKCPVCGSNFDEVYLSNGKMLECKCPRFTAIPWNE